MIHICSCRSFRRNVNAGHGAVKNILFVMVTGPIIYLLC
jgi:hypothetical protein